jgi:hypothetical protein
MTINILSIFATVLTAVILGGIIFKKFFLAQEEKNDDTEAMKNLIEKNARLETELDQKNEEIGSLKKIKEDYDCQKGILDSKEKEIVKLEATLTQKDERLRNAGEQFSKLTESNKRREKEHEEKLRQAEAQRQSFENQEKRVLAKEQKEEAEQVANRDRVWNEHENTVLSKLREICQKPEIAFRFFENTNLPDNLDVKIKPDFLVDFLSQYLIFDAKKSRDPRNYFREQAKSTAKKYKNESQIYSTVFFVFPADEIAQMANLSIFEDGILFFAISIDTLEPILRNFKKISEYENISEFDPADREKIVDFIAELENHINFQNAANLILTRKSLDTFEKSKNLNSEIVDEIAIKKNEKNIKNFSLLEIKNFLKNQDSQKTEIQKLVAPAPKIAEKDLNQVLGTVPTLDI